MSVADSDAGYMKSSEKKKPNRWIYFIAFYILALIILLGYEIASYDQKSRNSNYYLVLVHNKNENRMELHGLKRLKETLQNYKKSGVEWSLFIPESKVPLQYDDGDTFYSVERVSPDEQIVQLTYELAIGNHPTVKYRVKNELVEPMFIFGLGNYFLAFFVAILLMIVIDIIRYSIKAVIWIKGRLRFQ